MKKNNNGLLITILSSAVFCFVCLGMVFLFPTKQQTNLKGSSTNLNNYTNEEINLGDDTCGYCMSQCQSGSNPDECAEACASACSSSTSGSVCCCKSDLSECTYFPTSSGTCGSGYWVNYPISYGDTGESACYAKATGGSGEGSGEGGGESAPAASITCKNQTYADKEVVIATCSNGNWTEKKARAAGAYTYTCKGDGGNDTKTCKINKASNSIHGLLKNISLAVGGSYTLEPTGYVGDISYSVSGSAVVMEVNTIRARSAATATVTATAAGDANHNTGTYSITVTVSEPSSCDKNCGNCGSSDKCQASKAGCEWTYNNSTGQCITSTNTKTYTITFAYADGLGRVTYACTTGSDGKIVQSTCKMGTHDWCGEYSVYPCNGEDCKDGIGKNNTSKWAYTTILNSFTFTKDTTYYCVAGTSGGSGGGSNNTPAPYCYIDESGVYHWTTVADSGWKIVSGVSKEADCKETEDPACYLTPDGGYIWGKYAKTDGYKLITSIKTSAKCKSPEENEACYRNEDDNDYVWSATKPDGYILVEGATKPAECVAPEDPACYLHGSDYVWGKYEKISGYILIENIGSQDKCKAPEIPVPKTDIDVPKVMYICMAVLMAFGIGFIYYSTTINKHD